MNGDDPKSDRATVALVAERIESLRELTKNEFANQREKMEALVGLPVAVAQLERDVADQGKDIKDLQEEKDAHREWRRGPLLIVTVGTLGTAINLLIVFHP